jgi:hypothetical protein
MSPRPATHTNRKKRRGHSQVPPPIAVVSESPVDKAIGLNQHLAFFDTDADGKISVAETRDGLERLGIGHLLSVPGALAINVAVTVLGALQGKVLSPTGLPLPAAGFVRHDDTEFVDDAGVFDDAPLREAFARFGKTFAGEALTVSELSAMVAARVLTAGTASIPKLLGLPMGLGAVAVEWGALLWMAGTKREGMLVLTLADVRRFYTDPKFFDELARRLSAQRHERSDTLSGRARNLVQSWLL